MDFEWDEEKRATNIAKHGIDFSRAITIWTGNVLDPIEMRIKEDEARYVALGVIGQDEIVIAIVYTLRNGIRRIISARRGRRNERKSYQDKFSRGA